MKRYTIIIKESFLKACTKKSYLATNNSHLIYHFIAEGLKTAGYICTTKKVEPMENDFIRVWRFKQQIHWAHTDATGKLSPAGLMALLQEAAWQHAKHIGFGFEALETMNQAWVLIRQAVQIERYPNWEEVITIETWPRGAAGLIAFREFRILIDDVCIGTATSSWMVIDTTSRRPQKIDAVAAYKVFATEPLTFPEAAKVAIPKIGQPIYTQVLRQSQIDQHNHLNNAEMVRIAMDAFSTGFLKKHQVKSFTWNFIAESFEEEEITIMASDDQETLWGVRSSDEKIIFAAKYNWLR